MAFNLHAKRQERTGDNSNCPLFHRFARRHYRAREHNWTFK